MMSFFNPRNIWLILMTAAIVIAVYMKPAVSIPEADKLKDTHLRSGLRALSYQAVLSRVWPSGAADAKKSVQDSIKMYEKLGANRDTLPVESYIIRTYMGETLELPDSGRVDLRADLKTLYVDQKPLPAGSALFALGSRDLVRFRQLEIENSPDLPAFKSDLLMRAGFVTAVQTAIGLGAIACFIAGIVITYVFFKSGPQVRYFLTLQTLTPEERRTFLEAAVLYCFMLLPVGMALGRFLEPAGHPLLASAALMILAFLASAYYFYANTRPGMLREIVFPQGTVVWKEIAAGFAGFAAIFPAAAATLLVFVSVSPSEVAKSAHPAANSMADHPWMILFMAAVLAPVFEEVVFRCFLYGHFRADQRMRFASFFSGAVFAVLHPQGALALPYLTVLGMGLAVLREYRPGALAVITTHATVNGMAVVLSLFFQKFL